MIYGCPDDGQEADILSSNPMYSNDPTCRSRGSVGVGKRQDRAGRKSLARDVTFFHSVTHRAGTGSVRTVSVSERKDNSSACTLAATPELMGWHRECTN
jgi:hypothetical protein